LAAKNGGPQRSASNTRRPAWNGDIPKDDEEARDRIIQAAKNCIERDGVSGANISYVAKEVGVTRQTVYRLFASSGNLIQTVAKHTTGVTLTKMVAHVNKFPTFQERVVEAIIYLKRAITRDNFLGSFFSTNTSNPVTVADSFTPESLEFSFQMLKMLYPYTSQNIDEARFRQLAEHIQRVLFAIILAPSPSTTPDNALRIYLHNWLTPAVDKLMERRV
jgi:AcrR family transcriptional regulator